MLTGEGLTTNNTLKSNNILNFILRIDSPNFDASLCKELLKGCHQHFDRTEERLNRQVELSIQKSEVMRKDREVTDYRLHSSKYSLLVTLSVTDKAIWIEIGHYINNKSYKDTVQLLIESLRKLDVSISSNRIGMRYFNEFKCPTQIALSKIFSKRYKAVVKNMIGGKDYSRAVAIEEYNYSDLKARVQYGVLNKVYPAKILNYDASLDIDIYDDGSNDLDDWEMVIKKLKHKAYDIFKNAISEKLIREMK